MTAPAAEPSAGGLQAALAAIGAPCVVEARGRLALLRAPGDDAALGDAALRERVVLLAREHGFTHAALELEG